MLPKVVTSPQEQERRTNMYTVRFWNRADECIRVAGKFAHDFDNWKDAWDAANALLKGAYKLGAVEVDINNTFFMIVEN